MDNKYKEVYHALSAFEQVELQEKLAQANRIKTQFHGYDLAKLPDVLISLSAKLFNNEGIFWEATVDQMPERVQQFKDTINVLQARIDALMLEYCPDEMTPEQMENCGKYQRRAE